jgi:hypothetical protein
MKIFVSLLANLSRPFSAEAEMNRTPEAWPLRLRPAAEGSFCIVLDE